MTELSEIINDLNITIADIETFASYAIVPTSGTTSTEHKDKIDSLKRAVGQMKVARSSLISATRLSASRLEVKSGSR